MTRFDWDTSDRFISNNGTGPLIARILAVADGKARMERWHRRNPKRTTQFELMIRFLQSTACGWRKADQCK